MLVLFVLHRCIIKIIYKYRSITKGTRGRLSFDYPYSKKLNELKADNSNVNVYLNKIVDEAISFYYEHTFSRSTKS